MRRSLCLLRFARKALSCRGQRLDAVRRRLFHGARGALSKRRLAAATFSLLLLRSAAMPFVPVWIGLPEEDNATQVWFRNTYSFSQKPRRATIIVATTGYAELFVNGRNVSADVLSPTRERGDKGAVAVAYDVTRFMREGGNTVAVWYSPLQTGGGRRQLSLVMYGTEADGQGFCRTADSSWLCRPAPVWTDADGTEHIEGRELSPSWLADDFPLALWRNAVETDCALCGKGEGHPEEVERRMADYRATRVSRIAQPKHFDIQGDTVVYDFGGGVRGMLRVTLRGTARGERIDVGNVSYVCAGYQDEQIIQRFSLTSARQLALSGDESFAAEQVIKVEILTTENYWRVSR